MAYGGIPDRPPVRVLANTASARKIRTELTRRGFLATAIAASGAVLFTACAPGKASAASSAHGGPLEDKLSIYTWSDYDAPEVLTAFTKKKGPKVVVDAFNSNEELIAKLVAARGTSGYDIVVPSGLFILPMAENGLLEKLNLDLIPNFATMNPSFIHRSFDPKNEYSICKAWGTTGFVYDRTVIKRELTSWADFIDAAQKAAEAQHISGKAVTPFLLSKILELTDGRSLKTNIALVENNARLAAEIAKAL